MNRILLIFLLFILCSCSSGHKHWDKMYESLYNISKGKATKTTSDDIYMDIKNYFVLNDDSLYMINRGTMVTEYQIHSFCKNISYNEFSKNICTKKEYFAEAKDLASSHAGKVDNYVIRYFASHSIKDCIEKYCMIDGRDTILMKNEITTVYCFDKEGYNCVFNYGDIGNTKVTRIHSLNLLPRVPITNAYDIYN